jgi:tetratricopeptide (TPR) repeat protein
VSQVILARGVDEIVGRNPGLWEVTDREFSADFLEMLERRLLEGTLAHLDPLKLKRLTMLAVHRKSFEASAFEALTSGARKEWRELRHSLLSRFLVQLRYQWHSMNPVVREISLARLRENVGEFKAAHSIAADHHLRHFRARNLALDNNSLTGSFAELRYHLFHAGRTSELREVALRLGSHFKEHWNSTSPVPQDRAELDERIGVLAALLQNEGPKSLEYYLARCLQTRGSASDLQEALVHVTRATIGKAPAAVWFLRASLHKDLGDRDAAVQAVLDAVQIVDPGDAIGTLYGLGGQVLAEQGRIDDALILMREGILKVPPSKNLFTLYQSAAELLGQAGKTDDAVALLKEGIKIIPADKNLFSLYQSAAEFLGQAGKTDDAVALLKEGIKIIPGD